MQFQLPLKVFLSYSHHDSPDMLKAFRSHLKPLEKDKVIKVWFDRDITTGENWDDVIQQELQECGLFVALTSHSFNSSAYIEGKEMRVAWDRHAQRSCLLFPVLWEKWHVPEQWRKLQFVPGLDKDVIHCDNPNEAMVTVVDEIDRVARKLADGGWNAQSATTQKAGKPAERADRSLPYLCDWSVPIQQLQRLKGESDSDRPLLLVLVGREDDCMDSFLNRVRRDEIARLHSAASIAVHDPLIMDWPAESDGVKQSLNYVLRARADAEGASEIQTIIEGWNGRQQTVLEQLLHDLEQPHWKLPANRTVLFVLCVSNAGWLSWLRKNDVYCSRIEKKLKQFPKLRSVTIALPKIEKSQARLWFRRPEVKRLHDGQFEDFDQKIKALYLYGFRKRLRMKPLARGLRRILNQSGAPA